MKAALFPQKSRNRPAALCLFWLALAVSLQAAPYGPDGKTIEYIQPDGTKLELKVFGDEFYARTETRDGYTVAFDSATKQYRYAMISSDGTRLEPTALAVGAESAAATMPLPPNVQITDPAAAASLEKHLDVAPSVAAAEAAAARTRWERDTQIRERWEALKAQRQAIAAAAAAGLPPPPAPPSSTTTGTKVGLTLLIDFSDDPATVPQAEIVDFLNADAYTGYGNNGSVKQYFADNSATLLTYSNVVTAYVRMAKPKTFYNDISKDCGDQANLLIEDAIAIMKTAPGYDPAIFDSVTVNGSKEVVACNVFYAGGNGGRWMFGLWPHSWSLYNAGAQELSPGGKKVYRYQITDIGSSLELGTFCHENGHMLCGFPDIYDYTYNSIGGAGKFCLMNSGGHGTNPVLVCAYLKLAAGWSTATDLVNPSTGTGSLVATPGLTGYNQIYRYGKPGVSTEYFLLENRQASGRDAGLPASGIAIWHIDELGDRDNPSLLTNSTHSNYEVTLVQADNLWHFQGDVNSGDANDLYYATNRARAYKNTFNDTSTPPARWWDGSTSGVRLQSFSTNGPTNTFSWNFYVAPPSVHITKPASGEIIMPGYPIIVESTITDTNKSGAPGVISNAVLLVDDVPVLTNTVAPYSFTYTPATNGTYKLTVQATDTEDETGEDSVTVQYRYSQPGDVRKAFVPPKANDFVQALASDETGRIYVGGKFTALTNTNGVAVVAQRVARLLADGTVDTNFFSATGPNAQVRAMQYDRGRQSLYIAGDFTNVQGLARTALARLAVGRGSPVDDGALDQAFDAEIASSNTNRPAYVRSLLVQDGGEIVIAGSFDSVKGVARTNIARLNPDGSLDSTFVAGANGAVNAVAVQSDGKILAGGQFTQINGTPRARIARLNGDGTLDTTFDVGSGIQAGFDGPVNLVAIGPDASVYAGGQFSRYNAKPFYNNLAKLSSAGVLVGTYNFTPGLNAAANDIHLRTNGSILVSGSFTSVGNNVMGVAATPVGRVVQLQADGTVDPTFNPAGAGANNPVLDSISLANGDILLAGGFTLFNGTARSGLAVVAGFADDAPPVITSQPSRAAKAGDCLDFNFTASGLDPKTFSIVGSLPRGLHFDPATGRVWGVPLEEGTFTVQVNATGGASPTPGPTSSFVISVAPAAVSYDQWKQAWFFGGDATNNSISGPSAVHNAAGLPNLAVYALTGGDPRSTNGLVVRQESGHLTLTAQKYALASYAGATSPALVPAMSINLAASWLSGSNVLTTITNTDTELKVRCSTPMSEAAAQFMRLEVTQP